jgi:uncharacterized protein (DUF433 family)
LKPIPKEKVMPRWGKTDHIHITVKKGVCDGAPIVRGTRTSVANIAGYYCLGLTPEEIQRELPHLGLAQIFDALAFYFDHRREIDLEMEQELEEIVSKEFPSDKY